MLCLVALRLAVRLKGPVPELPSSISRIEGLLAKAAYVVFYLLMFGTPLVGFLMTNAFGFKVSWFGLELPKLIDAPDRALGRQLSALHTYMAYTLLVLAMIHVSAVIKHYVVDKVNLLTRMW